MQSCTSNAHCNTSFKISFVQREVCNGEMCVHYPMKLPEQCVQYWDEKYRARPSCCLTVASTFLLLCSIQLFSIPKGQQRHPYTVNLNLETVKSNFTARIIWLDQHLQLQHYKLSLQQHIFLSNSNVQICEVWPVSTAQQNFRQHKV